jgi:hypothetical protein
MPALGLSPIQQIKAVENNPNKNESCWNIA